MRQDQFHPFSARTGVATPWVRTVGVLVAAQVVAELAFSFALPFTPLFIRQLGVGDLTAAGDKVVRMRLPTGPRTERGG
jgi:hypothetical protein